MWILVLISKTCQWSAVSPMALNPKLPYHFLEAGTSLFPQLLCFFPVIASENHSTLNQPRLFRVYWPLIQTLVFPKCSSTYSSFSISTTTSWNKSLLTMIQVQISHTLCFSSFKIILQNVVIWVFIRSLLWSCHLLILGSVITSNMKVSVKTRLCSFP